MPSEESRCAVAPLTLFAGVLDDAIGREVTALARSLAAGDAERAREHHRRAFALLAAEVELGHRPPGDPWRTHLVDRLLADENPFSRKCEIAGVGAVGSALLAAARGDLRALRALHELDGGSIACQLGGAPSWTNLAPLAAAILPAAEADLRRTLEQSEDWGALAERLGEHYAANGAGQLARFRAFRWVGGESPIEVVADPDPVRLGDLIGYDAERELVVRNTEHFVAGHAANNVLLYGDRGTGKSSTVKALLNTYGDRGLRLIELPKALLGDLNRLLGILRDRHERFIVFVDDLSFDEHETHYKDLKAILEGGVERRPTNVLLYATSNRRHLIVERFSDRGGPLDEIHASDTLQEKLSFSDRFGISVTFAAPDQERYLQIVSGLAAARGIELSPEELRRRALEWAAWQNGRSGRTARQLVDFLAGELGLPPEVR